MAAISRLSVVCGLLLVGWAAGCTYSHGDPAPACDVATETVTYAGVISPIFDAHCRECHGRNVASTRGASYDFGDYQGIDQYFSPSRLLNTVKHAPGVPAMPQGRAKLSDCDIQRIEKWIAAGKPNN